MNSAEKWDTKQLCLTSGRKLDWHCDKNHMQTKFHTNWWPSECVSVQRDNRTSVHWHSAALSQTHCGGFLIADWSCNMWSRHHGIYDLLAIHRISAAGPDPPSKRGGRVDFQPGDPKKPQTMSFYCHVTKTRTVTWPQSFLHIQNSWIVDDIKWHEML